MSTTNTGAQPAFDDIKDNVLTEERLLGSERRWRRLGEPVPAGSTLNEDGSRDHGLFGPGSVTWEVLLHPATIVFETVAQATLQLLYKPIPAGIRDEDPISRKARAGTYTVFDGFERAQRNSGMHAPMWLGNTETATRMAAHLGRVHRHVKGDIIDVATPELGGYAAAEPRDAMWAAITELHSILWMYERFAYHGEEGPRPLTEAQRDQYVREMGAYLRLVGAAEDEIPGSMAELDALYDTYGDLFGTSETINVHPETGQDMHEVMSECMRRNWHPSHQLAVDVLEEVYQRFVTQILAAFPERIQIKAGLDEARRVEAARLLEDSQDLIRRMQLPENERRIMRMMWGPDGVALITNARDLHQQALRERAGQS
ncbi:oxygenase MpaB family protein [Streptomyces sp. NPDC051286]|uniref:oxygenase MpaB family protein n=1 Tax=Streptomyces sp. NPDC051286 TaxID=3365647 RepID=UPI0037AEC1BB